MHVSILTAVLGQRDTEHWVCFSSQERLGGLLPTVKDHTQTAHCGFKSDFKEEENS